MSAGWCTHPSAHFHGLSGPGLVWLSSQYTCKWKYCVKSDPEAKPHGEKYGAIYVLIFVYPVRPSRSEIGSELGDSRSLPGFSFVRILHLRAFCSLEHPQLHNPANYGRRSCTGCSRSPGRAESNVHGATAAPVACRAKSCFSGYLSGRAVTAM